MKFVFLKSGDYLEFTSKKTKFITAWFDFLFEKGINLDYQSEEHRWYTNRTEEQLSEINRLLATANDFLKLAIPDNTVLFKHNYTLDQQWLNDTHRTWAMLTDRYKNEIYDIPLTIKNAWNDINNLIHFTEQDYSVEFNNLSLFRMPATLDLKVTIEDCEYTQRDLILSYDNLGRHQYNQWEVGSDINEETNNYKTISTSVVYSYSQKSAAVKQSDPAPIDYVNWCSKRNLEVYPPHVVLGRFNLSPYAAREIIHRNLKDDRAVGFEL